MFKKEFTDFIKSFEKENNRKPYVFISGAITNRIETYKAYFNEVELELKLLGVKSYNPAIISSDTPWEVCMDMTLDELEIADAVFVLVDYEDSKGTLMEIKKAKELSIPIFYQ